MAITFWLPATKNMGSYWESLKNENGKCMGRGPQESRVKGVLYNHLMHANAAWIIELLPPAVSPGILKADLFTFANIWIEEYAVNQW